MGQASGAFASAHDAVNVLDRELKAWAGRPVSRSQHLLLGEECEVHDDSEQVVEVVGDPSGKLAEALETLRLIQLALELLSLGHVFDHRNPGRTPSVKNLVGGDEHSHQGA